MDMQLKIKTCPNIECSTRDVHSVQVNLLPKESEGSGLIFSFIQPQRNVTWYHNTGVDRLAPKCDTFSFYANNSNPVFSGM